MNQGNILVTGGAGYIGSHIVLALQAAGFGVVILDDLSTGQLRSLHESCVFVKGDVGDRRLVYDTLAEYECVGVMHLAGSIIVPESVRRPFDYYANNTSRAQQLVEACVAYGLGAFVFSSTAAVYGLAEKMPVSEHSPTVPINAYGHSKLMTEQILLDAVQAYDLPVTMLRYFNVAGADPELRCGPQPSAGTHLIKVACDVALGRRDVLQVFGTDYSTPDGTCIRDFIHVSDLAQAHVAALRFLLNGGNLPIANCGYGRGYSVREIVAAVERVTDSALNTADAARRPGDPPMMIADNRLLQQVLGFQPQRADIDLIINDTYRWMQLHG